MGLFGKLKEILFDEETVEIPVITKEERLEESRNRKAQKEEAKKESKRLERRSLDETKEYKKVGSDEVVIKKIETPKKDDDLKDDTFDMPKLKEEAKKEKKINTFTFPVFEDEEKPKNESRRSLRSQKEEVKKEEPLIEPEKPKRATGYTNAYDYSYGKYKGDYKSSRESNHELLTKTLETKEENHVFKPSPIISPVYGVLNENYKKEDIVAKSEKQVKSTPALDLDSVRRKAYGTLEDDIEVALSQTDEYEVIDTKEEEQAPEIDDKGISIDDLLVDDYETRESAPTIEDMENNLDDELFDALESSITSEEIELDEINNDDEEPKENIRKPELDDDPRPPRIPDDAQEVEIKDTPVKPKNKKEKESTKEEDLGEEDLFDLIDSLYEGKEEE